MGSPVAPNESALILRTYAHAFAKTRGTENQEEDRGRRAYERTSARSDFDTRGNYIISAIVIRAFIQSSIITNSSSFSSSLSSSPEMQLDSVTVSQTKENFIGRQRAALLIGCAL